MLEHLGVDSAETNVIFGKLKDGSLEIKSLALNNVSVTETSSKMVSKLCQI